MRLLRCLSFEKLISEQSCTLEVESLGRFGHFLLEDLQVLLEIDFVLIRFGCFYSRGRRSLTGVGHSRREFDFFDGLLNRFRRYAMLFVVRDLSLSEGTQIPRLSLPQSSTFVATSLSYSKGK